MRIQYAYIDDCSAATGAWDGRAEEAINAAVDHLNAIETGRGYIYLADETDEAYLVPRDGMLAAGAAILDGAHDWYSIWCSAYGRELSRPTRDKYFTANGGSR